MTTTRLALTSVASAMLLAAFAATAQTAGAINEAPMPMGKATMTSDKSFVNQAAQGGMAEVKLSTLALSNGQSPAVKEFAQHMVDDHTKANDELAGIAKGKGMSPPDALDRRHQKMSDKFASMKGSGFDQAYWTQMLADHQKTIALFQKESSGGKDPDIKAFATKTLPTLQMHLQMVQDAMKGGMAHSAG